MLRCRLRLSSSRWFCVGVSNSNNNNKNNNSKKKKKNHRIMIDSSSSSSTTLISSSSSTPPLMNTNTTTTTTIDDDDDVYKYENYYSHYLHSDSFNPFRWSSRESYEYMLNRGWQQVVHFYSSILILPSPSSDDHPTTTLSFSSIFLPSHQKQKKKPIMPHIQSFCEEDDAATTKHLLSSHLLSNSTHSLSRNKQHHNNRGGRWDRLTFKILLSYLGSSFHGWQKQPGLNTVQSSVEETLGRFVDEMKAEQLRGRGLPVQGTAVVAGRTDKGVSALHQVCSFYTWRKDVKPQHIIDAFGEGEQGKLRIVSVSEVSRVFHPNFCAKWRRYLYIFPFNDGEVRMEQKDADGKDIEGCLEFDESTPEISKKPMKFEISKVNELLSQLEGKLLSYKIFARDTKASRSTGPPTECFMFHARAAEARLPSSVQDGKCTKAMCVELVANRFLRKMVRVLVATAIREAAAGAEEDALIKLMDATCRRATAPPAPPEGLCLVDVGYDEFDPSICYV